MHGPAAPIAAGNGLCECAPCPPSVEDQHLAICETVAGPTYFAADDVDGRQVSDARIGPAVVRVPHHQRAECPRRNRRPPTSFLLVMPNERIGAFKLAQAFDGSGRMKRLRLARRPPDCRIHLGVSVVELHSSAALARTEGAGGA